MSITINQFYAWSGYTASDVNVAYLTELLSSVDMLIQNEVGALFTLTQIDESNLNPDLNFFDYEGNNLDYVTGIGAWQKTGLVVKIGSYPLHNNNNLFTLVEKQDYRLVHYQDRLLTTSATTINPVVGIRLNKALLTNQFIRVSGTYGWSNGYPADLQNLLFQIIKTKLEYNQNMTETGGKGTQTSESSVRLSVNYSNSPDKLKNAEALSKDIMADPQVARIISNYKKYTFRSVGVI